MAGHDLPMLKLGRHLIRLPTPPLGMAILRRHAVHGLLCHEVSSRDATAAAAASVGFGNSNGPWERSRAGARRESGIDDVVLLPSGCMGRTISVELPHHG